MNNKERSRNEAGKHTALDRQGLIWESRAPQAPPPSSLHRTLADPALSPWLNLPGATSSINPTLPVRPFQPSQWPSQPPAAFQEAPRPAAEHLPELFRGPAMRPAHPDADGLKPQTLEERHDRDAWPQGKMPRPETMEWRPDRDAWPQGKLPEIQTLEERHNRDAWPQGKMPDPRTLEGRSDMQGLTWEDLPKAPLFPTAADRATAEMVRQALLPGGKVPEGALLASTPPVRPAEAPTQAPPPLWQGRLGADLSDKAEDITIHSRQGNGTYLTSVGGRAPQPLDEGDVTALTDLPTARLQALAAQSEKRSPAAAALLGAAPGAAAALPPLAEQKASQQTATPGLPPAPARPPAPVPPPPRLERTLQPVIGRDEPEEKLAAAGRWRVEDLPAFFQDPLLQEATPPQRLQLLNDVLAQAGREYADRPGFGKQQYLDYQSVAAAARQQVQEMETWGEKAQGVGRFLMDVGTGALRSTIATAADTTIMEPDAALNPENPRFRMPLGNVAQQAGHWFDKAGDTADRALSWGADQELDAGLADLQKDLATGNLPLGDRAAFNAWVDNYARRLSQAQAAWYEAVQGTGEKISHKGKDEVMDQTWLQTYARTNGLNAPHNAALLAEYLHTQDPAVLDRLTASLKKTPQRARAERDQAQSLQDSSVVNFLTQSLDGGDYAQVMADAGNPLEIASNVVPILRGARAGAKAGGSTLGKLTSAAGSAAADIALEAANLAVENPDAHLADYLASGRDAIAAALGLHGTGMAIGTAAQAVDPALTRMAEAAGEKAGTALAKRLHGDLPPGSPPAADSPPNSGPQAPLPDIPLAISEFNPQILQEAPSISPTADPLPQPGIAPPPLWKGPISPDLSDEARQITIHRRNEDGTYQTSLDGGPPQPLHADDLTALTDVPAAQLQALATQAGKNQTARPGPTAPPQAAGSTNPAEPKASQEPAPGTAPRPPDIPPLWQGTARHGEAAEVLRRNPDGTYQVRRNGSPEETFKESQVAAMTRMHKPELHAHMAQALQRQEEAVAGRREPLEEASPETMLQEENAEAEPAGPPLGQTLPQPEQRRRVPTEAPSPQRQQIESVVTRLQQQAPGLVHDRTLIFSNEAEALASEYAQQHPFTDKARAEMQGKDGFFDITTGSTVILADNIRRRAWETESQALTRTVIRHRIGYDGLSILFGNNKGDVKNKAPHTPGYQRWVEFSAQIPRTELDAIARDKAYRYLDGDPEALKLAWFAREVENTPSPEAMRPLARQMWDFLSDVVGKLFVKAGLRDARTPGFNADLKDYIFLARDAALKNGGQTPQSIATSSTSGRTGRPLLSTTLTSDGMPADTASRITSIWKPHRPAPADYLPENRTQEHLELFKGGAARVMVADTLKKHGPSQNDGTSFILPAWQVDELLAYANGDRGRLEDALGWERGGLGKGKLVVVTIPQPEKFNLRFPSGNEAGANKDWIPGGRLPPTAASQGLLEAILDLGGVKEGEGWTKTPLSL